MKKILVKDFEIKSRNAGMQLKGYENIWIYEIICKATGKKVDSPKFYHRVEAQKWLSKIVKVANQIIEK